MKTRWTFGAGSYIIVHSKACWDACNWNTQSALEAHFLWSEQLTVWWHALLVAPPMFPRLGPSVPVSWTHLRKFDLHQWSLVFFLVCNQSHLTSTDRLSCCWLLRPLTGLKGDICYADSYFANLRVWEPVSKWARVWNNKSVSRSRVKRLSLV